MYLVSIIVINFKEGIKGHFQNWDCRDFKSPELELELKSLELELELELKLFVSSGIGIGIENNGIGIELKNGIDPNPGDTHRNFEENMANFSVCTVPADGLPPVGARTSAVTVMTLAPSQYKDLLSQVWGFPC